MALKHFDHEFKSRVAGGLLVGQQKCPLRVNLGFREDVILESEGQQRGLTEELLDGGL